MRSRTLEEVAAAFDGWRKSRPKVERIPDGLWSAAVALLGSHSASAICRRLRLDPSRLKRRSQAQAPGLNGAVRRRAGQGTSTPPPRPAKGAGLARASSGGRAFVELAPPMGLPLSHTDLRPGPARTCRLTLESDTGTLSVLAAAPDAELLESVCRMAVGMLKGRAMP